MKLLALALLVACGNSHTSKPDAAVDASAGPPRAVVVAGDFVMGHPGVLSTLDLATSAVMKNAGPAMSVGDDPIVRHIGGELMIVNRADGNNITILDATTLALVDQLGTGPGSNPQDIAALGDKLYVATFGNRGVTVLTRNSTETHIIDLSADDPDGKPNCNSVFVAGTDLYVSCELLDDTMTLLPPRGPGKIYIVDTATEALKQTLTLDHENPFGTLEQVPSPGGPLAGDLMIPTVLFSDGTGCIEHIKTGSAPSVSCMVDNAMLGGYASRVGLENDSDGSVMWLAVPAADFVHANLRAFDLQTLALWAAPLNPNNEVIGDVVHCPSGEVVVTDTTMNANGLRVYMGTAEKTTTPLAVGLKPTSSHGLVCY